MLVDGRDGGGLLHANGGPIGFQFFGQHHGIGGSRPLAHFRHLREQGDPAVRRDAYPRIHREGLRARGRGALRLPAGRQIEAENESSSGLKSVTAIDFGWSVHQAASRAALSMARRIR